METTTIMGLYRDLEVTVLQGPHDKGYRLVLKCIRGACDNSAFCGACTGTLVVRNAHSACSQVRRFSSRAACISAVLFIARGLKLLSGFRYPNRTPFRHAGCGFASEIGISDFRLDQPCLEQLVYACFYIFWHTYIYIYIYGPKSKLLKRGYIRKSMDYYRGHYIRGY